MRRNLGPIVAGFLILIAGLLFFEAFITVQNRTSIVVAKSQLSPYISTPASQLEVQSVPEASVGPDDLTLAKYNQLVKAKRPLIPMLPVLPGQRIDTREMIVVPQSSFSIVLPDERVVAVTASASGGLLGAIRPGDVVDVQASGNGLGNSLTSPYAKIICVVTSSENCNNVVPGIKLTTQSSSVGSSSASVQALIAVAAGDAPSIAGQSVSFSFNPFCQVDAAGYFVSVRQDKPCQPPSGRLASAPPTSEPTAETAAQYLAGTPSGTTTTTDTGTTTAESGETTPTTTPGVTATQTTTGGSVTPPSITLPLSTSGG